MYKQLQYVIIMPVKQTLTFCMQCVILCFLFSKINFGIAAYVVQMLTKKLKHSHSSHMNLVK